VRRIARAVLAGALLLGSAHAQTFPPATTFTADADVQRAKTILSRGGAISAADQAFLAQTLPGFLAQGLIGRAPTSFETSTLTGWFPKLASDPGWRVTGEACQSYNCIAWSVGVVSQWLWPSDDAAAFDAFYLSYGFIPLAPGEDVAHAQVAFWVDANATATHGCRRVAGDIWESKLGSSLRILHKLADLESDTYGHVAKYYRAATPAELAALGVTPIPGEAGGDPCASQKRGPRLGVYDLGSPSSRPK